MKTQLTADGIGSKFGFFAIMVFMAVASSTVVAQNIIGINMAGRQWSIGGNTPMTLVSSDTAGVVPQQNWNNVLLDGHDSGGLSQIGGPNAGVVSDNSGTATSVTFSYTQGANATEWAVDQTTHTGNQQLLDGYWDIQGTGTGTCSFGNIPYSVYDVYVYVSSDGNGRTGSVNINGGPQIYLLTDASGYNYSTNLIQATATTQASATSAHYVLFTNVTGSSFQVVLTAYGNDVGVAGIQIVDISGTYEPTVSAQPVSEELYAGRTAQFTVAASGTAPFAYQWQTNGVNLNDGGNLFGSTSNVLTITNIAAVNAGNYDVVITNVYGSVTSVVAQLTVVVPVNAYEQAILTNNPVAYYRLNENSGDPVSTPNLPAFDYIGGDNGVYGVPTENLVDSIYGPQPSDGHPGFETGNGAVMFFPTYNTSQITIPSWNINTNTVTIAAWVYPLNAEAPADGLVYNRGGNVAGLSYSYSTNASGNYTLGYNWNNDPGTYFWNSGLVPPQNQWSLVVLVVTPTNATIYLANTSSGLNASVHTYSHVAQSFSGPIAIGNDFTDTTGNRVFSGEMDEVAVFSQALSQGQVLGLYTNASGVALFAPTIANQPQSQAPFAHQNARFTVAALGTQPLGYQWQVGTNGVYVNLANSGRVSGATSASLTITNVSLSDPTNYVVVVTNSLNSVTSAPVSLTVTASSYADAVLTNGAIAYYSFNETGDPAAGSLTAYDYLGGFNGTYGSDVKNGNPNYGIAGPQAVDGFPEFSSNNWAAQIIPNDANGHVTVTPWNLNTNTVTMTCWVRPLGVEPSYSGLVFSRGAGGTAGVNFSGNTDVNGNRTLSYTWGDTCCWDSQLAPPTNQWSFVALVVTPTNATIYLFNTNGIQSATLVNTHGIMAFAGTTEIGCDPFDNAGRNFNGVIDEAAVFGNSLSSAELVQIYSAGRGVGVVPQITMLTPSSVSGYPGFSATFAASVIGSGPFSYQWYQGTNALSNGGNVSGATTLSLTITNVAQGNAGNYTLVVTGSAGSATSPISTLSVGVPPSTPYNQVVLAAGPYAYWRLNETSGTIAHDSVGGHDGTYGSAMQLGGPGQESTGLFGVGADTAAAIFTQNTTNSWVTVPALNLNTNTVTIMAWVYPTLVPDPWSGIFMCSTPDTDGIMFRDNSPDTLGMYWNNGSFWYDGTGLIVPANQWSLVALSVEPTDATLYVMNSSGTNSWFNNTAMNVEPWSGPARIGNDPYSINRTFNGYINEVAVFNRTLTGSQLGQFYSTAITAQSAPLTIQIQKSGANVQLTWSQGVLLEATNVVGPWTTNSSATSPFTVTPTGPQMFYRLQSQ